MNIELCFQDENWSHNIEPRLQTLVTDLEAGLRRVVLRAVPDKTPPSASLSGKPIKYWFYNHVHGIQATFIL